MLYKKGYSDVTMVAGSDRVREFENILTKYNGVSSRHGMYNFDNIKVVSAGERDPDAEGASGMSASKMRAAAAKGDIKSFEKGLPRGVDADGIMKQVRKGMNLAASYMYMRNLNPVVSLEQFEQQQIRDLYIRDQIFNIGDTVDYIKEDLQGKVVRKGTNFIVVEDTKNNLHKAWIWDCIPVSTTNREAEMREHNLNVDYGFEAVSEKRRSPQDQTIGKDKPGTQPKKYYKGLSKDDKEKRADHFRTQKYKKGDTNYKPAPGDEDMKTQPSKHTQKYKKMFGELRKDLQDACWTGYKQVGMKDKDGKKVPNCVPEAYEIGADWANHTKEVTPGETPNAKPIPVGSQADERKITQKDVEEWASAKDTIDKYRERYGDNFKSKIDETKIKMLSFKDYVKI
jgi:hypothetical protein